MMKRQDNNKIKSLGVFCGSSVGRGEAYGEMAVRMARRLVHEGITMVYGGGNVGLMGIMASEMLAAGGEVVGVIPSHLASRELVHPGVEKMHVVEGMAERKALMAELSCAFVALPGGFGTLDEMFEMLTSLQLGLSGKPCGLLNIKGFWDPMVLQIERCVEEQFLSQIHRDHLLVHDDPESLLDALRDYTTRKHDDTLWINGLKENNRY